MSALQKRTGHGHPAVLRLLTVKGRLLTNRVLVIAFGLLARLRLVRAYALWPTGEEPMHAVEVGRRSDAAWIGKQMERRTGSPRGARRALAGIDPASWEVLRARALLLGRPPMWLVGACEQALGRRLHDPSIALRSPTGSGLSKAICCLFESGDTSPTAIAIAMASPSQSARLETEVERIESLRSQLASRSDLADALPLPPLFAGRVPTADRQEYLAIYPPDPRDQPQEPDREGSLAWLKGFQAATSTPGTWESADSNRSLEIVESAWRATRAETSAAVTSHAAAFLKPLEGRPVPWCAVHGDYWEGNLVHSDGRLRVYDWEWAELRGRPFLDPWSYEVGDLLGALQPGRDLVSAVAEATANVERWLDGVGIDPRFGKATAAPSLAQIAIRMRLASGRVGPAEAPLTRMMAAWEELFL